MCCFLFTALRMHKNMHVSNRIGSYTSHAVDLFLYTRYLKKYIHIHSTRVLNALPAVQLYCIFILSFVVLFLLRAFLHWFSLLLLHNTLSSIQKESFIMWVNLCVYSFMYDQLCAVAAEYNKPTNEAPPHRFRVCGKLPKERNISTNTDNYDRTACAR